MKDIKINNLKLREYKYYKILYKYNLIKDCLEQNDFVLFFYYDFLNPKQRKLLKEKIKSQNLKTIIIKNKSSLNLLSNSKFKHLNNLLNNNTLIIYNKDNEIIDQNIIKTLRIDKNLKLIGAL
jgi:ribosomal protein L10